MKNSKRSRTGLKSAIEEGVELDDVDINPIILDLMVRETFAMFDENKSGDIDKTELSKLLEVLGIELNEKKQNELMRDMDKQGVGTISYDDFVNLMKKFEFGNVQTHLISAFNEYDKDMDGEVSLDDLLKVSQELDEVPMNQAEAQLMIAFFKYCSNEKKNENSEDFNTEEITNANITKEEFINTMTRLNFLVYKSDHNNQSQDHNRNNSELQESKSGFYNKSYFDKSNYDESKII